jgi:hypothetical protein
MKLQRIIEHCVYGVLIALALTALWLVFNAPANFLNARVVYQGF